MAFKTIAQQMSGTGPMGASTPQSSLWTGGSVPNWLLGGAATGGGGAAPSAPTPAPAPSAPAPAPSAATSTGAAPLGSVAPAAIATPPSTNTGGTMQALGGAAPATGFFGSTTGNFLDPNAGTGTGTGTGSGTQGGQPFPTTTGSDPYSLMNSILAFMQDPSGAAPTLGSEVGSMLPGRSKMGEAMQTLLLNRALQNFQNQGPRSEQAFGLIQGLANQGAQSAPYQGIMAAIQQAQNRMNPQALQSYRDALTGTAQTAAAQGRQNSLQSLRDAGMFGSGGMGQDAILQAENLAAQGYGQNLRNIEGIMSQEEANRIGQVGQLAPTGANIYQMLNAGPTTELANLLRQPQNDAEGQLQSLLYDLAQSMITGDIAARSQPSGFEKIGVPLISGALGAGGSILGGLASAGKL